MEKRCDEFARWHLHSHENAGTELHEEDEAPSLSDLPLIHHAVTEQMESKEITDHFDFDFDFGSVSRESQMCTADEVFFKGQILPLRHSVSSDARSSIYRSRSTDNLYGDGLISSRSNSSSSSSSGKTTATATPTKPPRIRNQFHSHPSPSPRIRLPRKPNSYRNHNPVPPRSSAIWNIFRLGLLTPPEIAFQGIRTTGGKMGSDNRKFGSRNSTSSNGSSVSSCNSGGKKKKNRVVSAAFLPGFRYCSADAVDTVAPNPRVVTIRRSASESEVAESLNRRGGEMRSPPTAKKLMSDRRTFEWVKQLP